MAHKARYKCQETTTAPVISGRSHAVSQAGRAGEDGDNKDNKDHPAGDSIPATRGVARRAPAQKRKGGKAHAAGERCAEEDEDEEDELRIPGSFDFEGHDNGVVGVAGVGTVDPFNVVRTLGNLWRCM